MLMHDEIVIALKDYRYLTSLGLTVTKSQLFPHKDG